MAAADATLPPPAPAPARRILAWLARSRLAAAAADAVILSFLANLWLLLGAAVTADVGTLACGRRGAPGHEGRHVFRRSRLPRRAAAAARPRGGLRLRHPASGGEGACSEEYCSCGAGSDV